MIIWFHSGFAALRFYDPDDSLRLQQVRDWMAGQALWDVSQHRINPPFGGPMHWSRIVDMPIAGLILLTRPLLGGANAEIFACIMVPLLLLGGTVSALFAAARRLGGPNVGLAAALLLLTTPTILIQFMPLRIDHHGWQIWMGAVALAGAFDPRLRRGGIVCGLALAVWLQISSEGLPYAALFAAIFGLHFVLQPDQGRRFFAFAMTLGSAALALLVATKGWQAPFEQHCDALSAAYIWPLVAFAAAAPLAAATLGSATVARRLTIAAIGGGAALAVFAKVGGLCVTGDPFQSLGPVAYNNWYLQVMEGRPIWDQDRVKAGVILLPPLVGLFSALFAAKKAAPDGEERMGWLLLALLILGTGAIAVMVMRALSVAHLAALPSIAWLILRLLKRVQTSNQAVVRIFGSVALILLTPTGLCSIWGIALAKAEAPAGKTVQCQAAEALAPLGALPPALLFAPIDLGPDILIRTGHSVIGTAHHRNAAGITAVISGFMAGPEAARASLHRLGGGRGVDYVVTCNGLNEFTYYVKKSPHGLAAMLSKGRHPGWLQPIRTSGPVRIYKVLR